MHNFIYLLSLIVTTTITTHLQVKTTVFFPLYCNEITSMCKIMPIFSFQSSFQSYLTKIRRIMDNIVQMTLFFWGQSSYYKV